MMVRVAIPGERLLPASSCAMILRAAGKLDIICGEGEWSSCVCVRACMHVCMRACETYHWIVGMEEVQQTAIDSGHLLHVFLQRHMLEKSGQHLPEGGWRGRKEESRSSQQ